MPHEPIPVLEVGGTHVTAVLVTADPWDLVRDSLRIVPLDADGTTTEILDELAAAANGLRVGRRAEWVVAVPGPFDYEGGVGLFRDVGKFESLYGVDVRRGLLRRIRPEPTEVRFLNDADAFGVGEYAVGAARRSRAGAVHHPGHRGRFGLPGPGTTGELGSDGAPGRQHPPRRPRRATVGGDRLPAGDQGRLRRRDRRARRRAGPRRARHRRAIPAGRRAREIRSAATPSSASEPRWPPSSSASGPASW